MSKNLSSATVPNEELWGHPRGLFILFMTEMWERFSYYGMRALLILYMVDHLLVRAERGGSVWGYATLKNMVGGFIHFFGFSGELTTQVLSSQLYGLYTSFVYLTPILGGLLADQFWGQRKSVYIGGVLMAIGHFLMASETLFFLALLFLVLGNGCFKPNISTQVGLLYAPGDERRDRAFTLFYMGINVGALISPLICGTLGQKYGWDWGFGAAGVGMLLGLVVYHWGRGVLPKDGEKTRLLKQERRSAPTSREWGRIGALAILCTINIVFWAVYEQQGNTLQLWSDKMTDWSFGGWQMPSTWYQAFNPLFIILLAPALDVLWRWQARRGRAPSSMSKMAIGCLVLGIAFIFLIFSTGSSHKVSPLWLVGASLIMTIGELYVSPVGLSLVTKIAPARMVSMLMGVWFLSNFLGNYLSGWVGGYYEIMSKKAFFTLLMAMGIGAGLTFLILRRPLLRLMDEPSPNEDPS